ncbi:MAG: T9SS type A sorting domain-containing protein, partial [Bacteroidota bacterium]
AMTGFFVEEASWPDYEVEGLAVSCHGQANGQIHIEVESGAMPFRYSLDDVHYQYGSSFAHLSAGSYMVYLRDDSDCVYTEAVVIEQPTALANEMISGAATCGYANGWMAAELSGGTPGYTYTWSNGATTGVIAELPSAWYGLTVQDEQGCTLVDSLYIENVAGPQLSAQSRSATCHDHTDGAIDLDILSSAPIRRVMWSNGARTEDIDALAAGTYAVTVVDRNECPTSETFEVAAPKPLQLTSQMDQMGNTAMIQVQPSGGTGNYTYQWSNGAEGAVLMGLSPGDYMLSLSDEQQCSHIATFTVLPVDLPLEDNILVYPVPTFDEVTVQLDLPERQAIELSLWDELGRMLMKSVEGELINESITLDLSSLPAAVYYLRVKVAADHFVYRLVKQQD